MEQESIDRSEIDWKKPDLNGFFHGDYSSHGKEIVYVAHTRNLVVATKITGDRHVPAGKVSFRMELDEKDWSQGKGQVQVAEEGFKNPSWSKGFLRVLSSSNFYFSLGSDSVHHFHRIDPLVDIGGVTSSIVQSCYADGHHLQKKSEESNPQEVHDFNYFHQSSR